MSVQAGIWNLDGATVSRESLARMSSLLSENGPDGEATYSHGSIGMLYRPFHTTAESRLEHQPHVSANGNVITWDGRLDNRDDLISQLADFLTEEKTDVAIVAAAFDRWDTNCFAKLIGDWSTSVWNPVRRELILARDYIGVKHLFYYSSPEEVRWCTLLAPLALCGRKWTLCEEYVAGYLCLWPEPHLTPYREVHSVPPGKFVRVQTSNISVYTHWTFNPRQVRYHTDAQYEEAFRHLLWQAVQRRLRTDSPLLAELSGGLDSSSIVCVMDDIIAKNPTQHPPVNTFSVYDSKEPGQDDVEFFVTVEAKRGKPGFHVDLSALGPSFVLEYPTFVATPGFGEREEMRIARSNVMKEMPHRVVLSGLGGDELLGQALDPRVGFAELFLRGRFVELANQLTAWSLLMRRPWFHLLLGSVLQLLPGPVRAALPGAPKIDTWINRDFARRQQMSRRLLQLTGETWRWRPSARDSAQALAALQGQLTSARPSLVEKRYPYLDRNLVEFLTAIPLDQLLRPGQRRSLMRRALGDTLPSEILKRQTKGGAGRCFAVSLATHWNQLETILRSSQSAQSGYVNQTQFKAALLDMKHGHLSPSFVRLLKGLSLETVATRGGDLWGVCFSVRGAASYGYGGMG